MIVGYNLNFTLVVSPGGYSLIFSMLKNEYFINVHLSHSYCYPPQLFFFFSSRSNVFIKNFTCAFS